ncbi:MAG TPA: hypothetical protein VK500_02705, partial [Nitrospiraceae bacterium]|nr:hypothetical protein [Nitrospiraceae bacterium]
LSTSVYAQASENPFGRFTLCHFPSPDVKTSISSGRRPKAGSSTYGEADAIPLDHGHYRNRNPRGLYHATGRTPSRIATDRALLLSNRRAHAEPERNRADSGQTRGRQND